MEHPGRVPFSPVNPSQDNPSHDRRQQIEVLITLNLQDTQLALLREQFPGVNFNHIPARRPEDIPGDLLQRIHVLYTDRVLPAPDQVPALRWLQFNSAGIDYAVDAPLLRKPDLSVTSMSGAISPQTAEYLLGAMISLGHHFNELARLQAKSEWPDKKHEQLRPAELRNSTVAIIGYGSIGRELARVLQPFNCQILAVKNDAMNPADGGYTLEGLGDPDGVLFTRLYPFQALKSVLKLADFVAITLPLTPQTRGMFNAEALSAIKPGAYLINIGRGGVVDEPALAAALQDHRLSGAMLDVFSEEPLPAASPLWKAPNLVITPHVAGLSAQYEQRAIDLFSANLVRFLKGERLYNLFNPAKGY